MGGHGLYEWFGPDLANYCWRGENVLLRQERDTWAATGDFVGCQFLYEVALRCLGVYCEDLQLRSALEVSEILKVGWGHEAQLLILRSLNLIDYIQKLLDMCIAAISTSRANQ